MVSIQNLHKKFGKNLVLSGVDLEINKGGIFAVLGPNGSGKTTLIKSILGIIDEPQDETFPGIEVLRISSGDLEQVDSKRLLNLTRLSLAELLGDKPLKSRSLFRGARG